MKNAGARWSIAVLEAIGRRLWGFPPHLMPAIVERLGAGGSLRWFVCNMPRYEATLRAFGTLPTHLLCTMISVFNGCPYCTYGHALAFELSYLQLYDELFPLDEHAIVGLHRLDAAAARDVMTTALSAADLPQELARFDRLLELQGGSASRSSDDDRTLHLIRMFAVLNACGIEGNVPADEAHDPLNKDVQLKNRYYALRADGA